MLSQCLPCKVNSCQCCSDVYQTEVLPANAEPMFTLQRLCLPMLFQCLPDRDTAFQCCPNVFTSQRYCLPMRSQCFPFNGTAFQIDVPMFTFQRYYLSMLYSCLPCKGTACQCYSNVYLTEVLPANAVPIFTWQRNYIPANAVTMFTLQRYCLPMLYQCLPDRGTACQCCTLWTWEQPVARREHTREPRPNLTKMVAG